MMDFTKEETRLLLDDGYRPGFMLDISEGDLVAIPPVTRHSFNGEPARVKTLRVERIILLHQRNYDMDSDDFIENNVVVFIGNDLDGLPEHCAYGNTYGCFIKTQD